MAARGVVWYSGPMAASQTNPTPFARSEYMKAAHGDRKVRGFVT
jgi:hypothetical protein